MSPKFPKIKTISSVNPLAHATFPIEVRSTLKSDLNGEEIFEGDILTYEDIELIVGYDQDECAFCLMNEHGIYHAAFIPACIKVGNFYSDKGLQISWQMKRPKWRKPSHVVK